jgi:hypothetical protein
MASNPGSGSLSLTGRRRLARAALAAMAAGVLVVVAAVGWIGFALALVGLLGAGTLVAGGYWFIAKRGLLRWVGLALAVVAIAVVVVVFFRANAIVLALISIALLALGGAAARSAVRNIAAPWMPTIPATPVSRPFIVMNPHSGGGKVGRFDLKAKAEALV